MAEEIKKEAPVAAASPDTRLDDANKVVKAQGEQLVLANKMIEELKTQLQTVEHRAENLERKLKVAKSPPTEDVVVLGGKTWKVQGTVRAKNALEEVKRGHIPEDVTLVIIDRPE